MKLSEQRLREIIRDELRPLLEALGAVTPHRDEPESPFCSRRSSEVSLQAAFSALQAERDKATFVAGLPPIDPTRWLSPAEAAAQLGLQPKTLANWRSKGIGPSFRHAGKAVRYDRYEIECYLVESGSRSAES